MRQKLQRGAVGEVFFLPANTGHRAAVYYRDLLGVRRRLSRVGKTKAAAKRALVKHVDDVLSRAPQAEYSKGDSVVRVVDAYLDEVREKVQAGTRSPGTLGTYERVVNRHVRRDLADWTVADFTAPMLDTYLHMVVRRSGYSTAKTCRTILSGAAKLLVRKGAISANPVRDVAELEAPARDGSRAFTAAQVRRFLKHVAQFDAECQSDISDLLVLLLGTGMRIGEALGLDWEKVDLELGVVSVECTIVRVRGEGLVRVRPKSKASVRDLVLPRWCVARLVERRGRIKGALVFPSSRGTYRDPSNTSKIIRRARGAEWSWVTSHTFRRTVATLMDERGTTARLVADQLGHSRVSMTQDVYMGRNARGEVAARVMEDTFPDLGGGGPR